MSDLESEFSKPKSGEYVEIPVDQIPEDTLLAMVKEFVEREATDYGQSDIAQETKVISVMKQIRGGKVHVVFSVEDESINLLTSAQFAELKQK